VKGIVLATMEAGAELKSTPRAGGPNVGRPAATPLKLPDKH
jgi:hypothetical protein